MPVTAEQLGRVDAGTIARRYGVNRHTVLRWARIGWVPSERRPGCHSVLFDLKQVEEALNKRFHRKGDERG
jgi:hypothetical protein